MIPGITTSCLAVFSMILDLDLDFKSFSDDIGFES
jgi:hypothetical protein